MSIQYLTTNQIQLADKSRVLKGKREQMIAAIAGSLVGILKVIKQSWSRSSSDCHLQSTSQLISMICEPK